MFKLTIPNPYVNRIPLQGKPKWYAGKEEDEESSAFIPVHRPKTNASVRKKGLGGRFVFTFCVVLIFCCSYYGIVGVCTGTACKQPQLIQNQLHESSSSNGKAGNLRGGSDAFYGDQKRAQLRVIRDRKKEQGGSWNKQVAVPLSPLRRP